MIKSLNQTMIMFTVLLYYLAESPRSSSGFEQSNVMCKEAERRALLNIKAGLIEYYDFLSSWGEEEAKRECCDWIGIRCNNNSGHVVSLDLSLSNFNLIYDDFPLVVKYISPSLVHLEYLTYLNLSGINFFGNHIPSFIGNLSKLRYLDLSSTSLTGQVPPQLGNLSGLEYLNLSHNINYDSGFQVFHTKSLDWVSRISSLRVLDLSYTNMATVYDWAQAVSSLSRLEKLVLHRCQLPNVTRLSPSLSNFSKVLYYLDLSKNSLSGSISHWWFNYSSKRNFRKKPFLEYISLASNLFEGVIPESLGNITTLKHLDLNGNKFEGSIPKSFGNMANLEYLNLENNMLQGEIPKSIWEICTLESFLASSNNLSGQLQLAQSSFRCSYFSLKLLELSRNQITGSLPNLTLYPSLMILRLSSNRLNENVSETIGQLSNLEELDLSSNSLRCVVSESHFSKLYSLDHLDLSNNPSLVVNVSSHWIPPFQLKFISLRSCHLGPHFPKWLQTQNRYEYFDISNSQISDSVPDMFWSASTDFQYMNLSYNQLKGSFQEDYLFKNRYTTIDLTSNRFVGSIPLFLFQISDSHLSHNNFTSLKSVCHAKGTYLSLLDISYNNLEGDLPDCWSHFEYLMILVLTNNKLSRSIPGSIGSVLYIQMLHLGNNNFTGKLPLSLKNCNTLEVLDLGGNRLSGPIPTWISDIPFLIILNLRSNQFNGSIPSSICHLNKIQLLDLSINNISGIIPNCVDSLLAMRKNVVNNKDGIQGGIIGVPYNGSFDFYYPAQVTMIWKGKLAQYKNTLRFVKSINLSNNKLVGKIPRGITKLDGLIALNLSRNGLTGQIPTEIGNLKLLDTLDLSRNHLSGNIPSSFSALNFLNTLDVSNNNLSGKIPTSTQLQSFEPSLYSGNLELCGAPLPKNCSREDSSSSNNSRNNVEDGEESYISRGFFVSLGLGFVVGFWGICGSLLFIKSWRYAYFIYLNGFGDWLYITIAMHKAKLLRIIKR